MKIAHEIVAVLTIFTDWESLILLEKTICSIVTCSALRLWK